ncbi:MAG: efflux RND transporter periplasmic adaptor subunit [Paludibacteraceae bacterium]
MKKILKIALWVLLGLVFIFTLVFLYQKSKPKVTVYQIETVKTGNIEKRTVATGKVEPRNEILIKPQMSGIITHVYKEAGDKVQAGDVIAKIKVVPELVNLNSAESRVELAQLNFDQSLTVYNRDKELFEKKVISKEEFEKSTLQMKNNKEELKSAQDNFSLVRDGISNRTAAYSNTLVRSTVTGTILDVPVKVGNSVIQTNNFNEGTTIASVADMSDMLFVGKLDETEIGRIHIGMPMDITVGALQEYKFPAQLEYISPKGKEESGAIMFEMKAAVKVNSDVNIRAGYSANAEILLESAVDVLTVPESCVEFSGDSAFVQILIKEKPQEFKKKQVVIGLSDGINLEIKDGLKNAQKIRGAEIIETKKNESETEK